MSESLVLRQTKRLAIVVVVTAAAAGCTGGSSSGATPTVATEPVLGPVATVTSARQVSRPLDQYLPSADVVTQLTAVEMAARNRCFVAHGVHGTASYSPAGDLAAFVAGSVSDRVMRSDLWGFFDADAAATFGYHRSPQQPGSISTKNPDGVSDDVGMACSKEGVAAVGGQPALQFLALSMLPAGGPTVPSTDSRYRAVVAQWSACMKERGYNYADPRAAIGDTQWRTEKPGPTEIATAVADVACKQSTNLVGVATAVQSTYDRRYIDAHGAELAQFTSQIDGYLRGAS